MLGADETRVFASVLHGRDLFGAAPRKPVNRSWHQEEDNLPNAHVGGGLVLYMTSKMPAYLKKQDNENDLSHLP